MSDAVFTHDRFLSHSTKDKAVVSLLAGPGMIQRLDFGGFIPLRPEVLSR